MTPFPIIRTAALLGALLASGLTWAAPACVVPQNGGMGGTGAPLAVGGMGGTGSPRPDENGGMGGTGAPLAVGGMGGTGSPQPAGNGGLGGTGAPLAVGGMGGAGTPQPAENGGFGGTGHPSGNTGILGTITGFGSVCVNGLEVQYDPATPVSRNGDETSSDRLALGQVVAIVASGEASQLTAKSIAILEALSGPVSGLAKDDLLQVMGQPVRLTRETRLAGTERLSDLVPGMNVRVSGYRNAAGEVVASRIEPAPDLRGASVFGPVVPSKDGEITVGGMRISAPSVPATTLDWLARGRWDGTVFRATLPLMPLPFIGHINRLVAEGLVLGHDGPGHVRISGFAVRYEAKAESTKGIAKVQVGQRIRVSGAIEEDGRLKAIQVELISLGASAPGGMSSGAGGMSSNTRMESSAIMAAPQRILPIVRPGAMGSAGSPASGHRGR